MCGFVGMIGLNGIKPDPLVIQQMSDVIRHRGPDDEGMYVGGAVGFGFRRLSILDLSPSGHQPVISEDGQTVLVFNGEIYNYIELREELESLGHRLRSSGDSEVLLHAYLQWGHECLTKMNGMWAFLIYDKRKAKLFGARDRFGKKPLFFSRCENYMFFGSEIKAILASGYYRGGQNWPMVAQFLLQGRLNRMSEGRQTFYSGIEEIPAGSAFEMDFRGQLKEWRYWSLSISSENNIKAPQSVFYDLFVDAVRLRLRSDVPLGIFLSGGLDSTSIACTIAKIKANHLGGSNGNFFAFSYQAKEFDESIYIHDTVKQTGASIIPFHPDPKNLWNTLERFLWHQDEPVHDMAAIVTFELSRLAAEHGVKVILNGGGADEILAGYFHYFSSYWLSLLCAKGSWETWQEINAFCQEHKGSPISLFLKTLLGQVKASLCRNSAYRKLAGWRRRRLGTIHPWYTPELEDYLQWEEQDISGSFLSSELKRSVEVEPLPLYLRMEDRNSMAHSVEERMPFLDHRLVSLAFQLPEHWKMRGSMNKYVLREAMRDKIPESVRGRLDKMGFPVPRKSWLANELFEPMQDVLNSQATRERGFYNLTRIRKDLESHRLGKIDIS
jgi:asparagine synthase (glutamine-hydrolysing)